MEISSKEASETIDDGSIDIIYIDASHDYESAKEDIELWFPKVKKGGMLVGHDYKIEYFGVVKAVNEKFKHFIVYNDWVWGVKK